MFLPLNYVVSTSISLSFYINLTSAYWISTLFSFKCKSSKDFSEDICPSWAACMKISAWVAASPATKLKSSPCNRNRNFQIFVFGIPGWDFSASWKVSKKSVLPQGVQLCGYLKLETSAVFCATGIRVKLIESWDDRTREFDSFQISI